MAVPPHRPLEPAAPRPGGGEQLFVVACNRCGESGGTAFAGKSVILDPWGEPLWEAGGDETLGGAVLDLEKVKSFREGFPASTGRAPDLY
nr:nitrilase-related carbon-nitrogen hydrolase [Aminiphilus circumscriptus]